jgi:DNA-binding MarR family transcriptional regulator
VLEATDEMLGFGDSLALARRAWILEAGSRLQREGFAGYRRSDAFIMRRLQRAPSTLGALGDDLAMTRQGARKIVDTLLERRYAILEPDPSDARKSQVVLTKRGASYARAIANVIAAMNAELRESVGERALDSATQVLRQIRHDFGDWRLDP